jgi:predicted nucleic acid-binding protein
VARPQVPDSTVLVNLIRRGGLRHFVRRLADGDVRMSVVVLSELYAGTRSRAEAIQLNEIVVVARGSGNLLTPLEADWIEVGRLMNRWSRLRGAIEPSDHLADALIVVSAARISGDVVSANQRHMAGWVSLARRSGLDVGLVG